MMNKMSVTYKITLENDLRKCPYKKYPLKMTLENDRNLGYVVFQVKCQINLVNYALVVPR